MRLTRSGEFGAYVNALIGAMRGSALKYNDLAPLLARKVSPREIAEAAEKGDIDAVVEAVDIGRDRAARVLTALLGPHLADIFTAHVEDNVTFELLDGVYYKSM